MIRLTTVGIVGALAACLAGCGTPPGAFIIVQNQVPNDDCTIPAAKGNLYQGEGIVDLSIAGGYELFPLLENDFPGPSGGQDVDGNRIALSGFDVEVGLPASFEPGPIADLIQNLQALSPDDPKRTLVAYSTLTSGSVASGGGNTASHVNVLPSDLMAQIRDLKVLSASKSYWIEVSVRARGNTLAGSVQSDAFRYPIQLVDGRLGIDTGTCTSTPTRSVCTPGQDGFVKCCENAGQLVCL
ncbi:MAG TPA: hypothetical protein VHK47_24630 [Polyangia bacterium]|jgi:hypothetical protein|nr:hypothetical protein [Polyangia bacterium]